MGHRRSYKRAHMGPLGDALVGAAVGSFLGFVLGFLLWQGEQWLERKRTRKSPLRVLLVDLATLPTGIPEMAREPGRRRLHHTIQLAAVDTLLESAVDLDDVLLPSSSLGGHSLAQHGTPS